MQQLTEYFKDKKVTQILDVGTGAGAFISVLKSTFPEASIIGVDPSVEALTEASKNHATVDFREMSAEKLEFKNESIDVVSISMALHHLPDVQAAFKEVIRVLKKGGWIIISELYSDQLNPAQESHKMFHHFRSRVDRILGISHNETFTRSEILDLTQEAGVRVLFHFDHLKINKEADNPEYIDNRVVRMKEALEKVKNHREYESLKPEIEIFRQKAERDGFQPAPRIVIVGEKL